MDIFVCTSACQYALPYCGRKCRVMCGHVLLRNCVLWFAIRSFVIEFILLLFPTTFK